MDLMLTPDVYEPSMDDKGNFIDKIPAWSCLRTKGIMCNCGSRKDWVYETQSMFTAHIKSKKHKSWIESLNANKVNFYMENSKLKNLVIELRQIVSQYDIEIQKLKRNQEIELSNKQQTIDCLTNLLSDMNEKPTEDIDLMDI